MYIYYIDISCLIYYYTDIVCLLYYITNTYTHAYTLGEPMRLRDFKTDTTQEEMASS